MNSHPALDGPDWALVWSYWVVLSLGGLSLVSVVVASGPLRLVVTVLLAFACAYALVRAATVGRLPPLYDRTRPATLWRRLPVALVGSVLVVALVGGVVGGGETVSGLMVVLVVCVLQGTLSVWQWRTVRRRRG
jgi:hypothetical protein